MTRIQSLFITFALLLTVGNGSLRAQRLTFIVASDLGRNGYYDQRPIARLMGETAEREDAEFVAAVGDIHHFLGVASADDPLWQSNYEQIYDHPSLMIPWHAVCGNHEYRGNTQAVLDYSRRSRRWETPSRYYTTRHALGDSASLRLIYIDTTPLIDKYRTDTTETPDAHLQSVTRQLTWIDSVLTVADREHGWTVVLGHHPVYAVTPKATSERDDMQQRLLPLLRRHSVDMYVCGHIHNFQHIRQRGDDTDYVVNSSASLARTVEAGASTVYCSPQPGFSLITAQPDSLVLKMIDGTGHTLHTVTRTR